MLPSCWAKPKPVVRLCGGNCSVMNAGSGAMTMAVSTASTEMSAETVTHEDDPTAVRIPAKAGYAASIHSTMPVSMTRDRPTRSDHAPNNG